MSAPTKVQRSDIRVAVRLLGAARVGHAALLGGADGLGVLPEGAGLEVVLAGFPGLAAFLQLGLGELDVDAPGLGVEVDAAMLGTPLFSAA